MLYWSNTSFINKPFTLSPSINMVRTNLGPVPPFPITSGTLPGQAPVTGNIVAPTRTAWPQKLIDSLPSVFSDKNITHMK